MENQNELSDLVVKKKDNEILVSMDKTTVKFSRWHEGTVIIGMEGASYYGGLLVADKNVDKVIKILQWYQENREVIPTYLPDLNQNYDE